MIRKISAVTFMLVMTLLITLKHPVIGYCLCEEAFIISECGCHPAENEIAEPLPCSGTPCSSCCQPAKTDAGTPCDQHGDPGNCIKILALDVGDFVWKDSSSIPPNAGFDVLLQPLAFVAAHLPHVSDPERSVAAIRGSPVAELHSSMPPLYLTHAVLRL